MKGGWKPTVHQNLIGISTVPLIPLTFGPGYQVFYFSVDSIVEAVKADDVERVKRILSNPRRPPPVNICHMAVKYGSFNVVKEYTFNCNASKRNENGDTWLDVALASAKTEPQNLETFIEGLGTHFLTKYFQTNSSDSDKVDGTENTDEQQPKEYILHKIAACGVKQLVRRVSFLDLKQKDENEDTALHIAAKHCDFETLTELVNVCKEKEKESELKMVLEGQNNEGETVLHIAIKGSNVDMVKFLIFHGVDLEKRDKSSNTPLHDLVDKAVGDQSNMDKYISIWKAVEENVLVWWCPKFKKAPLYNKSSSKYISNQRDAPYHLRSRIPNGDNWSVLQLAAVNG